MKLTEQIKQYYNNFIFRSFLKHSENQEFNKVFKKYKAIVNNKSLKQVTVGKKGLNIINGTNYKINKHKEIKINSLIIGIGIEEINFNLNLKNICCSPIYQTYELNDEFNNVFVNYFIGKIISENRNLITKKINKKRIWNYYKKFRKVKNIYSK